jgi:lysylphosphatidylglycerol synthetase-like protein (DUF2156 family)
MNDDRKETLRSSSPDFEVRYSPKMLRERRRHDLRMALFAILIAIFTLVMAFVAHRNHTWVDVGRPQESLTFPPSLVALVGVALLFFGAWTLWKNRKPKGEESAP